MNNKKSPPTIVVFAILTVITTFVWIGFDVYRAFTRSLPSEVPPEVLLPLDPTLDEGLLNEMTQTVYLGDEEIEDTTLVNLQTLQEPPTQTEPITQDAEPEEEVTQEETTVEEEPTDENVEN